MAGDPLVLLLLLTVGLGLVSLPIACIVDALRFTDGHWALVSQRRRTWVLLLTIGTLAGLVVGVVAAVEYLRSVRPELQALASYEVVDGDEAGDEPP